MSEEIQPKGFIYSVYLFSVSCMIAGWWKMIVMGLHEPFKSYAKNFMQK